MRQHQQRQSCKVRDAHVWPFCQLNGWRKGFFFFFWGGLQEEAGKWKCIMFRPLHQWSWSRLGIASCWSSGVGTIPGASARQPASSTHTFESLYSLSLSMQYIRTTMMVVVAYISPAECVHIKDDSLPRRTYSRSKTRWSLGSLIS